MNKVENMKKENLRFSQNLTKKNNEVFTDIVCYLRVSNLTPENQEEVISDILRMFLDCQENNKSIESVIGEDYRQFTDDVILSINPKLSIIHKVKEYSSIAIMGFCLLVTINFIFEYLPMMIKEGFNFNYQYPIELGTIINCIIILFVASAIFNYIGKNSFELSNKNFSKLSKFVLGASFTTFIIFLAFLHKLTGNIIILSVNISYILGIISIYWIYQVIKKIVK